MTSKQRSASRLVASSYSVCKQTKKKRLTFKEVVDARDLIDCFRLRYQQYDNPAYRLFLNENIHELDIDAFDTHSRHWAVYSDLNQILGYARIVQKEENVIVSKQIQKIIEAYDLTILPNPRTSSYLPILRYQPDSVSQTVEHFFQLHGEKNIVELSRFMIRKGSPLRTSKFMVNAGLGIYKHMMDIDKVVLACNDTHEKFWSLYGFRNMFEDQTYHIGTLKSVNLCSDLSDIHTPLSRRLEKYARQYESNQKIYVEL